LSPLEEVAVEDRTIRHEISVLGAYIEQHVVKFYRSQSDSRGIPIRRLIAEAIINNIIEGTMNGTVTLPPLSQLSHNSGLKHIPQKGRLQRSSPETLNNIRKTHRTKTVMTTSRFYAS
jgi:hypothetical protein